MKRLLLLLTLPTLLQAQLVTVVPPAKFNSTPPAADQSHKAAAATACNNSNVGQGPLTESKGGNTYCQHGGTNYASNGSAIWGTSAPNPTGALALCLNDVAGSGSGVPTNGCVIVLDPEPTAYWAPPGNAADHLYANGTNCIRNWWGSGNVTCHGFMAPVFQANPSAPQFIYFITTQYGALPPVGTRVNPSDVLPGDGYSHPLNLQPNINPHTQMGLITTAKDNNAGGTLFFGDGPMYYQFDGFEITSQSIAYSHPSTPPLPSNVPAIYGHSNSPLIYTVGEGLTGGRAFNVINNGLPRFRQDGVIHTVNTNYPWILECHMDGPKGPDMMGTLIAPNVNHTIFCDTYATHMVQGQTTIMWSWNARLNGDLDISMPALTAGGTKYSANSGQCAAGATTAYTPSAKDVNSQEATLGNVCVVDTSFQCDGVSVGQCFKVQFVPAQNATVATCNAAATATTDAAVGDNVPQCFNGGVHSFYIDTPPTTAPAVCFGPWANPAADGSDCAAHWVGGGPWAAGTEHVMTSDGIRVAFDSTVTPQYTIPAGSAGCTDNTLGIACERSPIDGLILLRDSSASGAGAAHNYTVTFTGNNTAWQLPAQGTLAVAVPANSGTITLVQPGPAVPSGSYLLIDKEMFYVTGATNYPPTVTVLAGRLGTIQAAHAQGAVVFVNPRSMTNIYSATSLLTPSSGTSASMNFTEAVGGWFMTTNPINMWGGTQSTYNFDAKYQDPASELDNMPKAAIGRISAANPPYYGVDFCSLPIGDGSLGPQYSRFTGNQVIKGRSYTIRCYLYEGAGATLNTTGLACASGSTSPCPDSFSASQIGLDFGADIPIDAVNVIDSKTMDVTFFVCDGTTVHAGHGLANECTPQIMADMGAWGGPWLEHVYVHGAGRVVHTGNAGDPGPVGADCAGDLATTPGANTWQCTMQGGQTSIQGIRLEGHNSSMRDSFMDNIWAWITATPETQGMYAAIGSGAHEWRNSYFVAGGEITFSGGSGSPATNSEGASQCDFYLFHNYYYRPRWWLNNGVGLVGAAGAATDTQAMENKNFREQKGGCRWEYDSNVHEENFWGYVQTYATTNIATRVQQVQPNMCCAFSADEYFHDNLMLNGNEDIYLYGKDTFCGIGRVSTLCGKGVFPPWSLHRLYMFNELYLQNKGIASQTPYANPAKGGAPNGNTPMQLKMGDSIRHTAINHITFEMQTPLISLTASGLYYDVWPQDAVAAGGTSCPNGTTVGPYQRDFRNFWVLNSVFGSTVAGATCGPAAFAVWPSTAPNDLSHRWAGNIWQRGPVAALANGVNTTTNYIEAANGPQPFVNYPITVPTTYNFDSTVGMFVGNYTPTGNATNSVVTSQVLAPWIGPSATATTDTLTAGYIKSRLDQRTAGVLVGIEGAAVPPTYTISGNVSGSISSGVTINLTGASTGQIATDSSGNYSFSGRYPGSFTITPSAPANSFTPASATISVSNANVTQAFTATAVGNIYSISGTVSGVVSSGLTVNLSGYSTATTTTDGSGNYTFSSLTNATYTVVVSAPGYGITPPSTTVTISTTTGNVTGVNFTTATVPTYNISGTISGLSGAAATVALSGAGVATTTTNSSGQYTFAGWPAGTYTITPSLTNYTFSPVSQSATISNANLTNKNFAATSVLTYSITGTVYGPAAVSGMTMNLVKAGTTSSTTTDVNGFYSFRNVAAAGQTTLTPTFATTGFVIRPTSYINYGLTGDTIWSFTTSTSGTLTIVGVVSGAVQAGVTLTLVRTDTGATVGTGVTNSSGLYEWDNQALLPYSVTPTLPGYTFNPASCTGLGGGTNTANTVCTMVATSNTVITPGSGVQTPHVGPGGGRSVPKKATKPN